jgi:hypothetical protein
MLVNQLDEGLRRIATIGQVLLASETVDQVRHLGHIMNLSTRQAQRQGVAQAINRHTDLFSQGVCRLCQA